MTEIEKNLKKMADEIPVPEKLSPDQIEKKLKNNRKKPHRYVRGVCVAAAAVIVVGAGVMMWQNQKMSPQKQQTTAEQYQNTTPPQDTTEEHKTYEEIRKSIDDYLTEKEEITVLDGDMAYSSATEDTSQTKTSGNSVNDYTKTNIQVEGIDEADMVKTDGKYIEIIDRKEAIRYAIEHGKPGDVIVLAGKGHEDYQEIKGVKHPMDERVLIAEVLKELHGE